MNQSGETAPVSSALSSSLSSPSPLLLHLFLSCFLELRSLLRERSQSVYESFMTCHLLLESLNSLLSFYNSCYPLLSPACIFLCPEFSPFPKYGFRIR